MPLISAYLCTLDRKFTGQPGTYTPAISRGVEGGIRAGENGGGRMRRGGEVSSQSHSNRACW